MDTDIVHIPAKVALVQLIDDPRRTVIYVPQEAFRDSLETERDPQTSVPCLYAPRSHLPWQAETFDCAPVFTNFIPQRQYVVYNVRVLDAFTTIEDRPNTTGVITPSTQNISSSDQLLIDSVRTACCLLKPKDIAASVQKIHNHLLRHQCSHAVAAHLPELLDTLLYHFYKHAADGPVKCQAMAVTVLVYFQIDDVQRRTRYAHRVMLMLNGSAGGPNGEQQRIGTRAAAFVLLAAMRWLEGTRHLCEVGDVMTELSTLLMKAVPKSHGGRSDWWLLQAAAAKALGLLVTLVPAAHLCHMWENESPMVPSLPQLLTMMNESRRLEVRIRVAVLITIILEEGRRHESGWFADRMPAIRDALTSSLAGTKFLKESDLTPEYRSEMGLVLRCLKNDLRPEAQHIGDDVNLTTWAGQQQYAALSAIFGEHFHTHRRENAILKQIMLLIG